jgi:hypothetical protein
MGTDAMVGTAAVVEFATNAQLMVAPVTGPAPIEARVGAVFIVANVTGLAEAMVMPGTESVAPGAVSGVDGPRGAVWQMTAGAGLEAEDSEGVSSG